MKYTYSLFFKYTLIVSLFSAVSINVLAQIIIDSGDMPSVDDTFRLSEPQLGQGQFNHDLSLTGADYVWNFTDLVADTSTVDTFFAPLQTPLAYNFVFTNPILYPDNFADLAQRSQTLPQQPGGGGGGGGGGGITFSDAYDFLIKSTSEYSIVGNAFSLNNVPSPNPFDGSDVVYEFPLNYQDQYSSNSRYEIHIPSLVDYYHRQTRTNTVDGWGMVYTPYGGFEAIRVKSVIASVDSIILSQLPIPFALPNTVTEYKWLAKNTGVPVLQINVRSGGGGGGGGGNNISSIRYLDSIPYGTFHYSGTTIAELSKDNFSVFPNPSADMVYLKLPDNSMLNKDAFIREISGKIVKRIKLEVLLTKINISTLDAGIYFIEVGGSVKKVIKQ